MNRNSLSVGGTPPPFLLFPTQPLLISAHATAECTELSLSLSRYTVCARYEMGPSVFVQLAFSPLFRAKLGRVDSATVEVAVNISVVSIACACSFVFVK